MNETPAEFNRPHITDVAWCPGCGGHILHKEIHSALLELHIEPENLITLSEIDEAIKQSGRKLVVIVESGDSDMPGEGGNHFIHALRKNADVTVIVHNNVVYDPTTPQPSAASQRSIKSPARVNGEKLKSFNPLEIALVMNAPFIARCLAGDVEQTKIMIKEAIAFKGFSVVDICQPCVIFNKLNTCHWFKKKIHYLPKGHDTTDHNAAFRLATGSGKLPLGILFRHEEGNVYEDLIGIDSTPLFQQQQQHDQKHSQRMTEAYR